MRLNVLLAAPTAVRSYARLLRPKLWLASMATFLIGIGFAFYTSGSFDLQNPTIVPIALLLVGPLVSGGAVAINQYFDFEVDRKSPQPERFALVATDMGKQRALHIGLLLLFMSTYISLFVSKEAFCLVLIAILITITYSAPPTRFKAKPFVDSVVNGIAYGVLPALLGWSIVKPLKLDPLFVSFPTFLIFMSAHMLLTVPDERHDRLFRLRTTAVFLGPTKTIYLAMSFMILTFALLGYYILIGLLPLYTIAVFPLGVFILHEYTKLIKGGIAVLRRVFVRLTLLFILASIAFSIILFVSAFIRSI